MLDWYPLAVIDEGNDAGPYSDTGEPKGLLHTTEGKSYAGARGAYVANNSWPHFTCTYEQGFFRVYQHNPLSLASRSLRNESGGVQTNTDNVVQIELVGSCNLANLNWGVQYVENFPDGYLSGIRDLMIFIEQQKGVPPICNVTFKSYPSSSGLNNGVRLTNSQWDAYTGWLGHQHAAENSHGDPGLINITYLLQRGDWFDMNKQEFFAAMTEWSQQVPVVGNLVTPATTDTMPMAATASYNHEASYWTFINGQNKPMIMTTHENPTYWYATVPFAYRAGPFTKDESQQLVSMDLACYHRSTAPEWPVYAIPQWVMDATKLTYEHLPIPLAVRSGQEE